MLSEHVLVVRSFLILNLMFLYLMFCNIIYFKVQLILNFDFRTVQCYVIKSTRSSITHAHPEGKCSKLNLIRVGIRGINIKTIIIEQHNCKFCCGYFAKQLIIISVSEFRHNFCNCCNTWKTHSLYCHHKFINKYDLSWKTAAWEYLERF